MLGYIQILIVALNIGGGSIELNGGSGTTSKNNIGIYINAKGSVKSTGDIKVNGGVGNLAIYGCWWTNTCKCSKSCSK